MKFFSKFGHVFSALFSHNSGAAEIVLHDVSSFVGHAEPIVQEIETGLKQQIESGDHGKVITSIQSFLSRYEPDLQKVGAAANELSAQPRKNLLQGVAEFALAAILPGVPTYLIRLAIEFAYSILLAKRTNPALAAPEPEPVPVPV